jgi:HKD family nuclease
VTYARGIYDQLLDDALARAVESALCGTPSFGALPAEDAASRLAAIVAEELRKALSDLDSDPAGGRNESQHPGAQLALINGVLADLRRRVSASERSIPPISDPPRVLRAIWSGVGDPPEHPETGLIAPWLFTAGRGSPALVTELRREAAACDEIDILVSFITVAGVRKLIDVLRAATAADATGQGRTRIRVLTTTYTGATEIRALDELARLNGCEVRISLDGRRTRLHAKAWIFKRKTEFGSAYVGSANLSGAALMGGLEWTVKFTQKGEEDLYKRAIAHFDTLWADDEFTPFLPDDDENRSAVLAALRRESGHDTDAPLAFFDIQPRPFQREMLEEIDREREQGRRRNLISSAFPALVSRFPASCTTRPPSARGSPAARFSRRPGFSPSPGFLSK